MSVFVIKIIACISMFLDHIKYAIPETKNFFTIYGGRIAFPLFAFLITEGYINTKNLNKYYKRLIVFAIISQIPFMLFKSLIGEYKILNIMFTLLLGLICITAFDKIKQKYLSVPIVITLIILGQLLKVDYGWFGVLSIFVIYLFRKKRIYLTIFFGLTILVYYYSRGMLNQINLSLINYIICNFLIPIICIWLYNGKLGKRVKYIFYWFYPVHMLIVYLISFI